MIATRKKNQQLVRDAIDKFMLSSTLDGGDVVQLRAELFRYSKFLVERMLERAEDNDCYLIDMLEDIQRVES